MYELCTMFFAITFVFVLRGASPDIKTINNITGQSLSELFATKNKVVYVSPTVHVSNQECINIKPTN